MSIYEQIGEAALSAKELADEIVQTCEGERDMEPHELEAIVRDNIRRLKSKIEEMETLI